MQSVSISRFKGQISKAIAATLCLIFLFSVFASGAQSGRKPPKRDEPPKPVQPPSETEPPIETKESAKQPKSLIPMLILRGRSFNGTYYVDIVTDGCAARLQKSQALKVNPSRTEVTRKEAMDQAKASEDLYVLWLEANFERFNMGSNSTYNSYNDVSVDYFLFAPKTGDRKSWGKIYLRPYTPTATSGGAQIPVPVPSNRVPIEYLIRQAGEDIADRVLSSLNLRAQSIY
jgi:hypothetical protein